MQKNRKRSDSPTSNEASYFQSNRYPVPLPELVNVDVLGTLLDEDLMVRLRALEADRNQVLEARADARPWEEEIAYIRREQQLRRVRRDAHTKFLRDEQDAFDRVEATLPTFDFDNTAFVYAASGGRPRWN